MEATRNSLGIILKRQAYREKDSLVSVYTAAWGKLSLLARGTQQLGSKLAGHIEPLSLVNLMIVRGKGLDYVGSAINSQVFLGIRQDLNKLYYAGEAISIFNRLVKDNQADSDLFYLLEEYLEALDIFPEVVLTNCLPANLSKDRGELFLAGFIWRLLKLLGYQPELRSCLACRAPLTPGLNYFDFLSGGVVCTNCLENKRKVMTFTASNFLVVSDNCLKAVRFLIANEPRTFAKLVLSLKVTKELSLLTKSFLKFCD